MTRPLLRAARAALCLTLCLGPVLVSLTARIPNIVEAPLVRERAGWKPYAFLLFQDLSSATPTYHIRLRMDHPEVLLAHQEFQVLFATYRQRPELVEASLAVLGTACRYRSAPGETLRDNRALPLMRGPECYPPQGLPTGEFELVVQLRRHGDVAVWSWLSGDGNESVEASAVRLVGIPGYQQSPPLLRGRLVNRYRTAGHRRIDLLAYVWNLKSRTTGVWGTLGAAAVLLLLGLSLIPTCPTDLASVRARRSWVIPCAAGMFAASLAVFYAILVPPFQAPDEPDYLLSFAALTGQPRLATEAEAWARLGHFERIKFHPDEKFRPRDLSRPFPTAWADHVHAEDVAARSPATASLWRLVAKGVRGEAAPEVLLVVRLTNALVFGLAVGLATLLVQVLDAGLDATLVPVPFLLVPTLPFFAMHMSESAVLTSGYVLLAACVTALALDSARSHWLGLPYGLVSAVVLAGGRSAGPIIGLLGAALLVRVVLGAPTPLALRRRVFHAGTFWAGWALGVSAWALIGSPRYRALLAEETVRLAGHEWNSRFVTWLQEPTAILGVVAVAGLMGEVAGALLKARWSRLRPPNPRAWMWPVACAVIAMLAAIPLTSVLVEYPRLQPLAASDSRTATEYVQEVCLVMATSLRLTEPDFLLTVSFWGGFGWIDTLLSPIMITGTVLLTGLAGSVLLVQIARDGHIRRALALGILGAGWVASLAAYALSAHAMQRNLHGRYLIGWYLTGIAMAWSSAWRSRGDESGAYGLGRVARWRTPLLVSLCLCVHVVSLLTILQRYF